MQPARSACALENRLVDGPPLIIDGGTGTEIERLGVPMHEKVWSARAALTHPGVVRSVHAAFLDAGAEIIIANSYSANFHIMSHAGLEDEFEQANRRAAALALEARNGGPSPDVWVAGGVSTTTFSGGIDRRVIDEAGGSDYGYRAQSRILQESGVDLLILEMMRDIRETRLCLRASAETALPVWLGMSADRDAAGEVQLFGSGIPFARGVAEILESGVSPQAVGVMHSDVEITGEALELLRGVWDGPVFTYPHKGVFAMPNWRFDPNLSPREFARFATEWLDAGVGAVGGCCGIRPDHIRALAETVRS